jgi:hypothetical protein
MKTRRIACGDLECKQAADLGDVATQKEGFSIVNTGVPAIATHLPLELHPHRSRIFLVGHHQRECQLLSPGLHCIALASNRRGM